MRPSSSLLPGHPNRRPSDPLRQFIYGEHRDLCRQHRDRAKFLEQSYGCVHTVGMRIGKGYSLLTARRKVLLHLVRRTAAPLSGKPPRPLGCHHQDPTRLERPTDLTPHQRGSTSTPAAAAPFPPGPGRCLKIPAPPPTAPYSPPARPRPPTPLHA